MASEGLSQSPLMTTDDHRPHARCLRPASTRSRAPTRSFAFGQKRSRPRPRAPLSPPSALGTRRSLRHHPREMAAHGAARFLRQRAARAWCQHWRPDRPPKLQSLERIPTTLSVRPVVRRGAASRTGPPFVRLGPLFGSPGGPTAGVPVLQTCTLKFYRATLEREYLPERSKKVPHYGPACPCLYSRSTTTGPEPLRQSATAAAKAALSVSRVSACLALASASAAFE
jgi:hypothetical protein